MIRLKFTTEASPRLSRAVPLRGGVKGADHCWGRCFPGAESDVCATHVAQDLTSGPWEEGVALPPGKICADDGRGQSAGRLEARGVALSVEEGGLQASHLARWREQLLRVPGFALLLVGRSFI